jgi:dihydroflavonol-4-reductase
MFFTSARAERELGYTVRPYVEALSDALDRLRTAGTLK